VLLIHTLNSSHSFILPFILSDCLGRIFLLFYYVVLCGKEKECRQHIS
jgi:hypothetical protein